MTFLHKRGGWRKKSVTCRKSAIAWRLFYTSINAKLHQITILHLRRPAPISWIFWENGEYSRRNGRKRSNFKGHEIQRAVQDDIPQTFPGLSSSISIGCKYFDDGTKNPALLSSITTHTKNCSDDYHKTTFDSSLEYQGITRHVTSTTVTTNSKTRLRPQSNRLHHYKHLINSKSGYLLK